MQKKIIAIGIGLTLLAGTAAYVAGRMLNNNLGTTGLPGVGDMRLVLESSVNLIQAEEHPTDPPQGISLFKVRMDNPSSVFGDAQVEIES